MLAPQAVKQPAFLCVCVPCLGAGVDRLGAATACSAVAEAALSPSSSNSSKHGRPRERGQGLPAVLLPAV